MNKIDKNDLNVSDDLLEDSNIQSKVNVEQLIFRQIERTNLAATQDETYFSANVRILLSMIPISKRDEILERTDEYVSTETHYEWKHWCGVPLGTVENPVNGSPAQVTNEVYDWHRLYEIILASLEDLGITWKKDAWTVETVRIVEGKPAPKPTPVFLDAPQAKELTQTTEETKPVEPKVTQVKRNRRCYNAKCRKQIESGTGVFKDGHLFHKECVEGNSKERQAKKSL